MSGKEMVNFFVYVCLKLTVIIFVSICQFSIFS